MTEAAMVGNTYSFRPEVEHYGEEDCVAFSNVHTGGTGSVGVLPN